MKRPFRLGLTGSIGMGKSTTAAMFAEAGVPVWDADATVHALYAPGGAAVAPLAKAFPAADIGPAVDRAVLKALIDAEKDALARIEAIVHPLVAQSREAFIAAHPEAPLVLLDMPLLFETGAEGAVDAVAVVSATPDVQRARVLSRPGMTEGLFEMIAGRQLPDADKRARADFIIETCTLDAARAQVRAVIEAIAHA